MQNFKVTSDKFNLYRIYTLLNPSHQNIKMMMIMIMIIIIVIIMCITGNMCSRKVRFDFY
jgi:hypothetical protein